jgi:hypothetical protein
MPNTGIGPMLAEVLSAQRKDEVATHYPQIEAHCIAIAKACERLDAPLVWPVSPAAERLAGAAALFTHGDVRLRGWSDRIDGERVLLLAVAAVTPIALLAAAEHARAVGAAEVYACGVAIEGVDAEDVQRHIDGYIQLEDLAPSEQLPVYA